MTEGSSDKTVARFLASGHCSSSRVKENAFLPPPDGELSVFAIDGLTNDEEVHALGRAYVSKPERKCKGFAEIAVVHIIRHRLSVNRDDQPPRHAVVRGWPLEKHFQKSIAQQLAADAILHYAPEKYEMQ